MNNFNGTLANGQPSESPVVVLVEAPPLVISPATLPGVVVGHPYSVALTVAGDFTLQLVGSLPPGLVFQNNIISGTPTTVGEYAFQIQAVPVSGLTITPTNIPAGMVGRPYSVQLTACGGSGQGYEFSLIGGVLPNGLTLSSTGLITGTPIQIMTGNIIIQATDNLGNMAQVQMQISISIKETMTPATLPPAIQGQAYSQQLTTSGGVDPYTYSLGGDVPLGLSISVTGLISGIIVGSGNFIIGIASIDSQGNLCSNVYNLAVSPVVAIPLSIYPTTLPSVQVNLWYYETLTGNGGNCSYSWSVTPGYMLPSGFILDIFGDIYGESSSSGEYGFSIRLTDTAGAYIDQDYSLNVIGNSLSVDQSTLGDITDGIPFSLQLTASGGTAPYTFGSYWGLPSGLSISSSGFISGTPETYGSYYFEVWIEDSAFASNENNCLSGVINTNPNTIIISPGQNSTADFTLNQSGSQQYAGTGASGFYTWSWSAYNGGSMPPGLSLSSSGLMSGTPTGMPGGMYQVSITATDNSDPTNYTTITVFVSVAYDMVLTPADNTSIFFTENVSSNTQFSVSGGTAPYTYSFFQAPPSDYTDMLTLSSDGLLSGDFTVTGAYDFEISIKCEDTSEYTNGDYVISRYLIFVQS